jgi:small subunit ribosomal protein S17
MRLGKHAKYSRVIKKYVKFKVHDELNSAKLGDVVRIIETRPLSKDKRFKLQEVVKKATAHNIVIKEEIQ